MADEFLEPVTILVPAAGDNAAPVEHGSDAPESGIEDLKRQLAEKDAVTRATQAALEEAQRRETAARADAVRMQNEQRITAHTADAAQFDSIVNAIAANQQRAETLSSEKAKALSDGDFEKAGKFDIEIGRVTARLVQLEDGKVAIEEARKNPQEPPRQAPASQADQREAWLAQQNPHNAAWIRQHSDRFFSDQEFQRKAIAASQAAVSLEGFQVGTPDYFRFIEEKIGLRKAEVQQQQQQREEPPRQQQQRQPTPPPAAPPSRDTPSSAPGRGTPIRLTAEERAHARATLTPDVIGKNQDGTPRDPEVVFAQHKAKAIAEGRWNGPGN